MAGGKPLKKAPNKTLRAVAGEDPSGVARGRRHSPPMRAVVQRVIEAGVTIAGRVVGRIEHGIAVLAGPEIDSRRRE